MHTSKGAQMGFLSVERMAPVYFEATPAYVLLVKKTTYHFLCPDFWLPFIKSLGHMWRHSHPHETIFCTYCLEYVTLLQSRIHKQLTKTENSPPS